MKLSDISNQQLAPGRYLITASYDGNDEYNPTEAQLILVIDENQLMTKVHHQKYYSLLMYHSIHQH